MKRQLLSSDDAVPATYQHTKPCSDCPWSRDSLPGWLGGLTADAWIAGAHGEGQIDCHTLIGAQCAGAATYRANVCKLPRKPDVLRLPVDRDHVFANREEFLDHHGD